MLKFSVLLFVKQSREAGISEAEIKQSRRSWADSCDGQPVKDGMMKCPKSRLSLIANSAWCEDTDKVRGNGQKRSSCEI
jgi:hypothetical protein